MAGWTIKTSKLASIYYEKSSGITVNAPTTRRATNGAVAWITRENNPRKEQKYERQNVKPRPQMKILGSHKVYDIYSPFDDSPKRNTLKYSCNTP